jgi:Uma2 family endonuclease
MNWKEVVADANLENLPYKIETNEWGQIVMTPTRHQHGAYQFKIASILDDLMQQEERPGTTVTQSAIQTARGAKVADVAWYSAARWAIVVDEYDVPIAPEICIEVLSPGNSGGEMKSKLALYFRAGAVEVWICDNIGQMRFYERNGELDHSRLVPTFPKSID